MIKLSAQDISVQDYMFEEGNPALPCLTLMLSAESRWRRRRMMWREMGPPRPPCSRGPSSGRDARWRPWDIDARGLGCFSSCVCHRRDLTCLPSPALGLLQAVAAGMNPMDLRKGIKAATDHVVTVLSDISKPISTKEEVAQVGTISANR